MIYTKQERLLEIFFRCLRGEGISVQKLADEYQVSTKSISRNVSELKDFFSEHRELVGNTELVYSGEERCYHLYMDEFLSNKELFALIEVLIGARAFSKDELCVLTNKLKRFTTKSDCLRFNELLRKELYHYTEHKYDGTSIIDILWKLAMCITEKREITIEYYRADREFKRHRICPASVMFTDNFFYLIAFLADGIYEVPLYFRVDRIRYITEHRKTFSNVKLPEFDEGLLRQRSLFMWPGQLRTIRFEFTGSAVGAVLDKLPTAKIIEQNGRTYTIEAEVYGDGIKMWLLSQGRRVKVTAPEEFVTEMKLEIMKMQANYEE